MYGYLALLMFSALLNSENEMSGTAWKICSGIGAQKSGCK